MTFDWVVVPDGINTDLDVPAGGTGKRIAGVDLAFLTERVQWTIGIENGEPDKVPISTTPKSYEWNFGGSLAAYTDGTWKNERYGDDVRLSRNAVSPNEKMIWSRDAKPLFEFCRDARHVEKIVHVAPVVKDDLSWAYGVSSVAGVEPFVGYYKSSAAGIGYAYTDTQKRVVRFDNGQSIDAVRYGKLIIDFSWVAENHLGQLSGWQWSGGGKLEYDLNIEDGNYFYVPNLRHMDLVNASTMTHSTSSTFADWIRITSMTQWGVFENNGTTYTADGGSVSLETSSYYVLGVDVPDRLCVDSVPD